SAQVAGFSQLLRGDPDLQNGYNYDSVLAGVDGAGGQDAYGYRSQFSELVEIARYLAWQEDLKVN
ncbi:MAG: YfbK domain-containing protein, partial [Pseudomonadota bacterium]|nr:YfbK domain-containing protein [Pseudomonadota bacterium]